MFRAIGSHFNILGQRKNLKTSGLAFHHDGTTFTFTDETKTGPDYSWNYNGRGELVEANDASPENYDRAYQYDSIGNREKTVDGLGGICLAVAPWTTTRIAKISTSKRMVSLFQLPLMTPMKTTPMAPSL